MNRFLHENFPDVPRTLIVVIFIAFSNSLWFVTTAEAFNREVVLAGGDLKGTVTDSLTNEALIGVTILVKGIQMGSATDIDGKYLIQNIPEGSYAISISYIGYETANISNVKIVEGQTTTLNYSLKTSATELASIEIVGDKTLSGKVIETNDLSLVNSMRTSLLITTGISAQQIARSADQDAGEVAKRLPGVSVVSNFVNIRGLSERYNLTILNGMIAPSSEAERRAFSYDLLPSNMIDKMTVYRSPAPELLADWAGGVIKIETKNSSIAREIEFNLSTSYRSNSTFEDYYSYKGGKKDWMGIDDGTRALPDGFPAAGAIPAGGVTSFTKPTERGPLTLYTVEELATNAALGRSLFKNYDLQSKSAGLDCRAGISYYDSRLFGKMRLSNLTAINTTQTTLVRYQEFNPEKNQRIRNGETIVGPGANNSYMDTISIKSSRWGLLQNLTLSINPKHTVQLDGIFNQLGTDEVSVRDGYNSGTETEGKYLTKIFYSYRSRMLLGIQLGGKHKFGNDNPHTVTWAGAYNVATEEIPAQRNLFFRALRDTVGAEKAKRVLYSGALKFNSDNNLYYSETRETNSIFSLDYEKQLKFGPTVKAGFFNENKFKPLTSRLVRTGPASIDSAVTRFNPADAFKEEYYKDDGTGFFISDDADLSGQYEASGKIYAGYVAVNIPLWGDKLKIYGGMRFEGQDLELVIPPNAVLRNEADTAVIDRYVYYWLPSVNVNYNFTKKMAVRAAYGKTINRPNYREMTPIRIYDPRLENSKVPNAALKDAEIHNYDLRLEYYPADGEFISIGAYYKNMIDAIEPYLELLGNSEVVRYSNTKKAFVYGAELEIRKSLGFLPWSWADNLNITANFALLKSEVELLDTLYDDKTGDFRDFRQSKRPLEGTANYVVNGGLYYDHPKLKTKVSVIYNVIGQRLISAGSALFPDTYELPRHSLDITLRQPITKSIELRASVQDVLNQPLRIYRDYDRDQQFIPDKRNKLSRNDWLYQRYKPGTYYTLGINIKI